MKHGITSFALALTLANLVFFPISTTFADDFDPGDELAMFFDEEELVETATRYPKPLMQVAENVSIITAEEIAYLNAHTLNEVLRLVPGLFVNFVHQGFGDTAQTHIYGAKQYHTLVLIDGVRLNTASGGDAFLNDLPLQIIERLEVIRGPASSAWGSAMGGVVNIITKSTGNSVRPQGMISGSIGERRSQDYNAELRGSFGALGYYLYGGRQESDGLRNEQWYENDRFYAKLDLDLPHDMRLMATFGYTDPETKYYEYPAWDTNAYGETGQRFGSLVFDTPLNDNFALTLSAYSLAFEFSQIYEAYGIGWYGDAGDLIYDFNWDEVTRGGSGRLTWNFGQQSGTLGAEIMRGTMDYWNGNGPLMQAFGYPATDRGETMEEERWGVYLNHSITWQGLSVTPGLRYDHNSLSESFVSPSLGLTYRFSDNYLLRASVARGFASPYLSKLGGGGAGSSSNPDLEPEEVWSYQAGLESTALGWARLKATLFYHEIEDAWVFETDGGIDYEENSGNFERRGVELELETVSFAGFSLAANYSYVDEEGDGSVKDDFLAANMLLRYNDQEGLSAILAGHYIWWYWGYVSDGAAHDDMTWDLTVSKELLVKDNFTLTGFASGHNLFKGNQYWVEGYENPDRWVEAGLKFSF